MKGKCISLECPEFDKIVDISDGEDFVCKNPECGHKLHEVTSEGGNGLPWKKIVIVFIGILVATSIVILFFLLLGKDKPNDLGKIPIQPRDSIEVVPADTIKRPEEQPVSTDTIYIKEDTIIYKTDTVVVEKEVVREVNTTITKPVVTKASVTKVYSFGKYVGSLKNGIPEGDGKMTYNRRVQIAKHDTQNPAHYAEQGDYFDGSWGNGDIVSGYLYHSDGRITKYSIDITAEGYKRRIYDVTEIRATKTQYFKIDPKMVKEMLTGSTVKVSDSDGKPLDNAKIEIKGTGYIARTDNKGICKIDLPTSDETMLVISHRQYEDTISVAVKPGSEPTVELRVKRPEMEAEDSQIKDKVKGKIVDESGKSLIGCAIVEKGITNGTVSDIDGNFEIKISNPTTLTFSYIGYKSENRIVTPGDNIYVLMKEGGWTYKLLSVGFGYGITCGSTFGQYVGYRYGKFGLEAGFGYTSFTEGTFDGSIGLKFYPHKSLCLSANYGTAERTKIESYNTAGGDFGIDGTKHIKGFSFLGGYDGRLIKLGKTGLHLNAGIGISITEQNKTRLAFNIGVGVAI